ncbi:MAG: hypothetical protein LBB36_05615, partial [Fibromonadaceae bacterium]|nr:hypothetical protein [Fibromonadaceae bacterium]
MRTHSNKTTIWSLARLWLAAMLILSCSTNEQAGGNQNQDSVSYSYCVFSESGTCLEGPYSVCPQNGMLSNNCPFANVSVVSSSSARPSSSSQAQCIPYPNYESGPGGGQQQCPAGYYGVPPNCTSSPPGVTYCPSTPSSSSAVPSSSSRSMVSENCDGYCLWPDGCVRIATDPTGEHS